MAKNDTPEDILRRIIKEGTQTAAVEQAKVALAQLEETKKQTEILDKIEKKKDSSVERSTKKTKEERKEYKEKEEGRLSRVTQKVSSGRGPLDGTLGNIAKTIGAGTIAASVGSIPSFRGVAAATLDAAGVGGLVTMGAEGGGTGGRRSAASPSGGGKNPGKESVGILESILNVLQDNNELLQDLLYSLTAAAKGRIEAEREANRKSGEAGKGVTDTDTKELEEQSSLGKWSKIIAAALGSVYGIILGWLKTLKFFAEALLPESLIKSIKGKFTAIGTFFDDVFLKLKTLFTKNIQNISVVFEEAFSKISNLFKSVGSESRLARILTAFGQGIIKLSAPFIEAFNVLKSLISGPANYIVNVFKSFSGIFTGVAGTAGNMMKFLRGFAGVFKFVSSIVSKLVYPLFVVMTLWDTVKGMIEGYEKEGIVGAIAGAVTGLFNSLLFGPLDMLKSAIAWVLGKFGFENAEKELNSFSFSEMFTKLIGTVKDFFIDIGKWVGEKMAGASVSFNEWWDSWSISGALIEKVKVFFIDIGKWVSEKMAGASVSFNEWWASWSITGAITTAFEDFKQKIINYFGPEFVAKIGEIANFDLAGYISKKIGEAIDTVKNMFANLGSIVNDYAYDLWESTIGKIPGTSNPLTRSTGNPDSETGIAAGKAAERSVLTAITKMSPRGAYTTQEMAGDQRFDEAEPTFNNQEQPTFTGSASANFGNSMADLMPIENPTAPAFLKRVNDLAISASAPAAPIIIDNSTKNNVTNSRPSSISPRVSSGTPSTAPVVSHMERAHLATVGVTP